MDISRGRLSPQFFSRLFLSWRFIFDFIIFRLRSMDVNIEIIVAIHWTIWTVNIYRYDDGL